MGCHGKPKQHFASSVPMHVCGLNCRELSSCPHDTCAGKAKLESLLPPDFEVALEDLCPNQAQPAGQKKGPSGRSKPKAEPKPAKAPAKRQAEPTECAPDSHATS